MLCRRELWMINAQRGNVLTFDLKLFFAAFLSRFSERLPLHVHVFGHCLFGRLRFHFHRRVLCDKTITTPPLLCCKHLLLSRREVQPQPVVVCFTTVGLALRPQPPRCRVEGPGGLPSVVESTRVVSLPGNLCLISALHLRPFWSQHTPTKSDLRDPPTPRLCFGAGYMYTRT